MPYTPPLHPSPVSSGSTLSGSRPSLPRSASRLQKHRRRLPVSVLRDALDGVVIPRGPSDELKGVVPISWSETADKALRDTGSQIPMPMVQKKSGGLLRPALAPSWRQPSFKAIHFDSPHEHVRHSLPLDRALAVSADSSPIDSYQWDTEYPFAGNGRQNVPTPPFEWEILTSNFPPGLGRSQVVARAAG